MSPSSAQFHRLVERPGAQFDIVLDGRKVHVQPGDLLISVILLNQKAVRRFEFSDAWRAGFCLMAACQDCWVKLGDGQRVRACDTVVKPGMNLTTGIVPANGDQEK